MIIGITIKRGSTQGLLAVVAIRNLPVHLALGQLPPDLLHPLVKDTIIKKTKIGNTIAIEGTKEKTIKEMIGKVGFKVERGMMIEIREIKEKALIKQQLNKKSLRV